MDYKLCHQGPAWRPQTEPASRKRVHAGFHAKRQCRVRGQAEARVPRRLGTQRIIAPRAANVRCAQRVDQAATQGPIAGKSSTFRDCLPSVHHSAPGAIEHRTKHDNLRSYCTQTRAGQACLGTGVVAKRARSQQSYRPWRPCSLVNLCVAGDRKEGGATSGLMAGECTPRRDQTTADDPL